MCGIFGSFNAPNAAEQTAAGLHHLQHRARDFAGIVATDGKNWYRKAGAGLVREVFNKATLDQLHGPHALGHVRYPTVTDEPWRDNTQPILQDETALAHNGNLTNAEALRTQLAAEAPLATSIDSECILRFFLEERGSTEERLEQALARVRGSYALGILMPDQLIAMRDPSGNRPLSIGRKGESWFVSSETTALDAVEAEFVRDVEPGEMVTMSASGMRAHHLRGLPPTEQAPCVFEEIYFGHPASRMFGNDIVEFRLRLGRRLGELFKERFSPVPQIDLITPVPDSSNYIALGVAQTLGVELFKPAITRSHDIGRTFIAANQVLRDWLVRQKFSFIPALLAGKSVLIVDDSIVRLTTLPGIVEVIRKVGATAVHALIACPPIRHPCKYGIDTPTYKELAAARMTPDEIQAAANVDTLTYLPLEDLRSISGPHRCFACMTGNYPLPV